MQFENVEPSKNGAKPEVNVIAQLQEEAVTYGLARAGSGHPDGGGKPQTALCPPFSDHGFQPGHSNWGPPKHQHWGWQDEARWTQGWDVWFWKQSPNYGSWNQKIENEAAKLAVKLDRGDKTGASIELTEDLYAMHGDVYAQNQLFSKIYKYERKGAGLDLYLGNWDHAHGSWDNIQIFDPVVWGSTIKFIPIERIW
jgi:hypothetical protein